MPVPAERLTKLPTYVFAVIAERLRRMSAQGIDVIRLDIGNPDMPPPEVVVDALARSARDVHHHGYTEYRGTPDFRAAVAEHYQKRFGVQLDPESEVLPLLGSKEGIMNLALAYISSGDAALVPDIGYPSYTMGARLAGGEVHYVTTQEGVPDLNSVPAEAARRAKLLWVNYPNNPTGRTVMPAFYAQLRDYCQQHDILLASDNPYVDIVYDGGQPLSALQTEGMKATAVEFMSFSKSYNMAGWRLGAAVGNAAALGALLKVKSNIDSGHFKPVYDAGITALRETPAEWAARRNAVYQARRDRVMATLPHIGLHARTPEGALYVWARVDDGQVERYLEETLCDAHVALAPGGAYGPGGKDYVRFSLATEDRRLDEALERLKRWYAERKQ